MLEVVLWKLWDASSVSCSVELPWETGRFIDARELSPPLPSTPHQPLINNGTKNTRLQMLVSFSHQLCQPPIHSLIDSEPGRETLKHTHTHTHTLAEQAVSDKFFLKSGIPTKCSQNRPEAITLFFLFARKVACFKWHAITHTHTHTHTHTLSPASCT